VFPEDWKLNVAIWDKGIVSIADQLIGATTVDLENRLYSNTLWVDKAACTIMGKEYGDKEEGVKKQIKKAKGKKGKKGKALDKKRKKYAKLKDEVKSAVNALKDIE